MNILTTTVLLSFIPLLHGAVFCPWKRARVFYCGSDGKTYNTLCDLQEAISKTQNLSVAHKGVCEGDNISTTSEEHPGGVKKYANILPEEPGPEKSEEEEDGKSSEEEDISSEEFTKEEPKIQTQPNSTSSESTTEKSKVSKKPNSKKGKSKKGKSKMKAKSKKIRKPKKGSSMNIKNKANNKNIITIGGKKRQNIKIDNNVNNKNVINIHYWLRMIPLAPQRSGRTLHRIFNLNFEQDNIRRRSERNPYGNKFLL